MGYPRELLQTHATVYKLEINDIGVKLQQKVNGQFKELDFV
jgi:hypothetical protein